MLLQLPLQACSITNVANDFDTHRSQQVSREEGSGSPLVTNGPLLSADPSISSNLQAMSSQLFQTKRHFRLAPTFSNVLLRPQSAPSPATPNSAPSPQPPAPVHAHEAEDVPLGGGGGSTSISTSIIEPGTANGTNDNGTSCPLILEGHTMLIGSSKKLNHVAVV